MPFQNRQDAGQQLAKSIKQRVQLIDPIIIALPRGGVPVGLELSRELNAPLEILMVKKIGAPENPEYAIGAMTESKSYWLNPIALEATGVSSQELQNLIAQAEIAIEQKVQKYRNSRPLPNLSGRSVILVDDGLATGSTAWVAARYLKALGSGHLIAAFPTCSAHGRALLEQEGVQVYCLETPENFHSVGQFYEDFTQVLDEELMELLSIKNEEFASAGILTVPKHPLGIAIFAHGSGSSKNSPRNQFVASKLQSAGIGTLLLDLLTEAEAQDRANVFNIPLLASRLENATRWVQSQSQLAPLPIAYFGASTGGAAALWAASNLGNQISCIVSRGGRPDLARERLKLVQSPTLLIVGENDESVLDLNRSVLLELKSARLETIPGATHLFEEPGTLEQAADLAASWIKHHLLQAHAKAA